MCRSMCVDVRDEDTQLVLAIFNQFRLSRETDSFLVGSRQHQLTQTLDAHFNRLEFLQLRITHSIPLGRHV